MAIHAARVAQAQAQAAALRYLTEELRRLLGVVVLTPTGLLDSAAHRAELDTLLLLLEDLRDQAPALPQTELTRLHKHLTGAMPGLLTFTPALDLVHRQWGAAPGDPTTRPGRLDLATARRVGTHRRGTAGQLPRCLAPRHSRPVAHLGYYGPGQ
jgi:hypothetical protein